MLPALALAMASANVTLVLSLLNASSRHHRQPSVMSRLASPVFSNLYSIINNTVHLLSQSYETARFSVSIGWGYPAEKLASLTLADCFLLFLTKQLHTRKLKKRRVYQPYTFDLVV